MAKSTTAESSVIVLLLIHVIGACSTANAGRTDEMISGCCCRNAAYRIVSLQGLLLLMVIGACSAKLSNLGAACPCKVVEGCFDLIVEVGIL